MGRYPRRKPVTHLTYPEPLYAVCYRSAEGEAKLIGDAPYTRRVARSCAKAFNSARRKDEYRAILCPVSNMIIDTTPLDQEPAIVVLEPSGKVVDRGSYDECQAIAAEANRLEKTDPSGQRAVVRAAVIAKGGAL